MTLETIPRVIGFLLVLVALYIVWLTVMAPRVRIRADRRRRIRPRPSSAAMTCLALAVAMMGVVMMASDGWRYSTILIFCATAYLLVSAFLSRHYLKDFLTSRGELRRRPESEQSVPLRPLLRRRSSHTGGAIVASDVIEKVVLDPSQEPDEPDE